jgi:putative ABC transport system ATP-binding protein
MIELELRDCHKSYRLPSGRELDILQGVNLRVRGGHTYAIVGRSGSGKSTLLNVLGLLTPPSRGEYRIDGRAVTDLTGDELAAVRGKRFGFVFQDFMLMEGRTATENVTLPLQHAPGAEYRRWVRLAAKALERVGLADRARSLPWQLSGGEQQRCRWPERSSAGPRCSLPTSPPAHSTAPPVATSCGCCSSSCASAAWLS